MTFAAAGGFAAGVQGAGPSGTSGKVIAERSSHVCIVEPGPNTTDWITAIATIFAAVGTVGAVVVALWQILRQDRRRLVVRCSQAVIADVETIHVVGLRATNDGSRPVRVAMAYLMTDDGKQVVSPLTRHSESLPKTLAEGDSLDVYWTQSNLDQVKDREGIEYLYAFLMDALGQVYEAPYPGVVTRRKGPRRKRVYELPEH